MERRLAIGGVTGTQAEVALPTGMVLGDGAVLAGMIGLGGGPGSRMVREAKNAISCRRWTGRAGARKKCVIGSRNIIRKPNSRAPTRRFRHSPDTAGRVSGGREDI